MSLEREGDRLHVRGDDGREERWPLGEVVPSPRLGNTPRILRREGHGQIECADAPELAQWFPHPPSRIEATLSAIGAIFPDRQITLARELTKIHEEFVGGTAETLLEKIKEAPLLGEMVVLIGPGQTPQAQDADLEDALRKAMERVSLREAVEEVAKGLGAGKKKVYNLALNLKGRSL